MLCPDDTEFSRKDAKVAKDFNVSFFGGFAPLRESKKSHYQVKRVSCRGFSR